MGRKSRKNDPLLEEPPEAPEGEEPEDPTPSQPLLPELAGAVPALVESVIIPSNRPRSRHEQNEILESGLIRARSKEDREKVLAGLTTKTHAGGGQLIGTARGKFSRYEPVVGAIPTGSLGLDVILGIGGFARGRVIEVYGAESSGKTTLALHGIAQTQRLGGISAFIDAEHAIDLSYAEKLGVDPSELLLDQPGSGEDGLQTVENLLDSGEVDFIVVDSVSALVPKSELEGDIGDVQPGAQARLMSQALRKITAKVHRSKAVLLFINQLREKIQTGGYGGGSPKTTSGGNALKFYASMRIEVTRIGTLKANDEAYGNRVKFDVRKNKCAPPFRKCEVDIIYGQGISHFGELLDYGCAFGIIQKSGSWYSYGSDRLGQGKDNSIEMLRTVPKWAMEIEAQIHAAIRAASAS